MRYLGIDYGNKKVGLAISDEAGTFAWPYRVVKNESLAKLTEEIKSICFKEGIGMIVVGKSLSLAGEPNPIQKDILIFKEKLEDEIKLPVELQTEFFTTQEARRVIDDEGIDLATDARAAALILKSFLDRSQL